MVVCVRVSFQGSGVLKHCTPRATPLATAARVSVEVGAFWAYSCSAFWVERATCGLPWTVHGSWVT